MEENQENARTLKEKLDILYRVLGIIVAVITIAALIPKPPPPLPEEDYYTESGKHAGENAVEYYKGLNLPQWTTHDNSYLTFFIGKSPLKITTGVWEGNTYWITVISTSKVFPVTPRPVKLSLIEYHTGNVAYEYTAQISNDNWKVVIPENEIKPDTLYYYVMKSDGFKTIISDEPFYLNKTSAETLEKWPPLEENDFSYGHPFNVQFLDATGNPVANYDFNGYTFHIEESAEPAQWKTNIVMYGFSTNQDGMVCWDNGLAKFEMQSGFALKVQNADGSYSDVTLKYASADPDEPDIATATVSVA